ncbi:MAG: PEP/pyruvate-binding domain-containing protein, partial [Chlamydiota bacterium]
MSSKLTIDSKSYISNSLLQNQKIKKPKTNHASEVQSKCIDFIEKCIAMIDAESNKLAIKPKKATDDQAIAKVNAQFHKIESSSLESICLKVTQGRLKLSAIPDALFFAVLKLISPRKLGSLLEKEDVVTAQKKLHNQKCGNKHDLLVQSHPIVEGIAHIPKFFGFTHKQICSLLSQKTLALWTQCQQKKEITSALQKSIKDDILRNTLPLTAEQKIIFAQLKATGKVLFIRSSSNEDGEIVNAGGNESLGDVKEGESFTETLAQVISSYFSVQSFRNRTNAGGDPFKTLPMCSVLVMEEIKETKKHMISSGVMMTSKPSWSSKSGSMTLITASFGHGGGTNGNTTTDQWVIQDPRHIYTTTRIKSSRLQSPSIKGTKTVANDRILQRTSSLTENQVKTLYQLGAKMEKAFGQPMNIEFVFKQDKQYIVQVRPVREAKCVTNATYLNPAIPLLPNDQFQGDIIVSPPCASNLCTEKIFFAKNLAQAEHDYKQKHKLIVVSQIEASSTHSAVNFGSQGIPCLALNEKQWSQAKKANAKQKKAIFCAQQALLVFEKALPKLNTPFIIQGDFRHPAKVTLTFDREHPMQGKSNQAAIKKLNKLLNIAPRQINLDECRKTAKSLFHALMRNATSKQLGATIDKIAKMFFVETEAATAALAAQDYKKATFHLGVLRQLINQSDSSVVGAHSLSGITKITLGEGPIATLIEKYPQMRELAFLGLQAFDIDAQAKWATLLEENKDHTEQLEKLKAGLDRLHEFGFIADWFLFHFYPESKPSLKGLLETLTFANNLLEIANQKKRFIDLANRVETAHTREQLLKSYEILKKISVNFLRETKTLNISSSYDRFIFNSTFRSLINLWDLTVKTWMTTSFFDKEVRDIYATEKVNEFYKFACELDLRNVLGDAFIRFKKVISRIPYKDFRNKISLEEYKHIAKMDFDLESWIINGTISSSKKESFIRNNNELLTVIHQNLLKITTANEEKLLPKSFLEKYEIFKKVHVLKARRGVGNNGVFVFVEENKIYLKINIPLNLHSSIVTIEQEKEKSEATLTLNMRASDNYRSIHYNYFNILYDLSGIEILSNNKVNKNLEVKFKLKNNTELINLSCAIRELHRA